MVAATLLIVTAQDSTQAEHWAATDPAATAQDSTQAVWPCMELHHASKKIVCTSNIQKLYIFKSAWTFDQGTKKHSNSSVALSSSSCMDPKWWMCSYSMLLVLETLANILDRRNWMLAFCI